MNNKENNTLIFKAMGLTGSSTGVANCRIRTRLKDAKGRVVFLELISHEITKYSAEHVKQLGFRCAGFATHAFYVVQDTSDESNPIEGCRSAVFEYTEEGIVAFVNSLLGTNFKSMKIHDLDFELSETDECLC